MSTATAAKPARTPAPHEGSRLFKQAAAQIRTFEIEDEFQSLYSGTVGGHEIIEPPYLPRLLESLCQQNNSLEACISAMVTNVHSTGFDITARDEKDEDTDERDRIQGFFDETYPGEGFTTLRTNLGFDVERTGNAYMEVIRNIQREIVFLRRLDPKMMRLVRLDAPRIATVSLTRNGEKVEAQLPVRYRRYAQLLNENAVRFFKQYGCPDPLHATRGDWGGATGLGIGDQATEVIHFVKVRDSLTPYGVPVWVSQMPSVLGSRRAEELNLSYFDNGGVPPMMVFIHGGQLTSQAADTLRDYLQGGAAGKFSIPVIEAMSTSGSMDSGGAVKVSVERFGSERTQDSMFETYDDKCEKRIRRAWRLPPLFVGIAQDYNFATAAASYQVAEAQVFQPERQEFDEIMQRTILSELDPDGLFEFKSRPISVRDVENQLKAIETAVANKVISREQLAKLLNDITNLDIRVDDEDLAGGEGTGGPGGDPYAGSGLTPEQIAELEGEEPGAGAGAEGEGGAPEGGELPDELAALTTKADLFLGSDAGADLAHAAFEVFRHGADGPSIVRLLSDVRRLNKMDRELFNATLTSLSVETSIHDLGGPEVASSVVDVVMGLIEGMVSAA